MAREKLGTRNAAQDAATKGAANCAASKTAKEKLARRKKSG